MSIWDSLKAWLGFGDPRLAITYVGPSVQDVLGMDAGTLYRTQPHLRTVVSFLARNTAQCSLQVFERVGDVDRRRNVDDVAAKVIARPNPSQTQFELMSATVSEFKLYDYALWSTVESPDSPTGWDVRLVPSAWIVATGGGSAWEPQWIKVVNPANGSALVLTADQFLVFHGYAPGLPASGASPVEALRQILAEQIQAWSYREQVWQRGGRVGTYITRPANAPEWSPEARTKFQRDWAAKWTGPNGPKAGGTPMFEDGMELKSVRFNAREEEWSDVAKLALATVAAVYHTSPTMVGILDNANFSNVKEFSRMLYTDTLGPDFAMFEDRINSFLIPRLTKTPNLYAEFNISEKMQGSFEEQAAVLSTAIGRPYMTADEGRAKLNLPALGGDADQLVTPLNVLVGGQASPRDTGTQNRNAGSPEVKVSLSRESSTAPLKVSSKADDVDVALAAETLRKFFRRQRAVVLSQLGSKSSDWWDEDRWNRELADDLYAMSMTTTQRVAHTTLNQLGVPTDQYSAPRTKHFLEAVAKSRAGAVNSTTYQQLKRAIGDDLSDDAEKSSPDGVFDEAEGSRASMAGRTLATTLVAFAITEVGKQLNRPGTTKTWVVTSANPRPSHAEMDGETVSIDDNYSNGMQWPGDPAGGVDEVANCSCQSELTIY